MVQVVVEGCGWIGGMGCFQLPLALVLHQPFQGEGAFDHGHHNFAGAKFKAAIHDQQIPVLDAGAAHGVAADA